MQPITMFIPVEPVAKGRPRFTRRGFVYTPKVTRVYEQAIKNFLLQIDRPYSSVIDKPLRICLHFFIRKPKSVKREYPSIRPDVDNYAKAVLDAMNGIVFKDDGQIISLTVSKAYHTTPGTDVWIEGFKKPE